MSTVLKNKLVYLSGPIEFDKDISWRDEPKSVLTNKFKLNIFDPFEDPKQKNTKALLKARESKDFKEVRKIVKSFVRKDLTKVDHSHLLIAYLPKGVPTTGTHHEIINANNRKIPVLLVCPQGKEFIPLWYFGFIKHERMFGSWNDLYKFLQNVNEGKYLKDDRWAYIYGLI